MCSKDFHLHLAENLAQTHFIKGADSLSKLKYISGGGGLVFSLSLSSLLSLFFPVFSLLLSPLLHLFLVSICPHTYAGFPSQTEDGFSIPRSHIF